MSRKKIPGLPSDFDLNVPDDVKEKPVQLGNYFEEEELASGSEKARAGKVVPLRKDDPAPASAIARSPGESGPRPRTIVSRPRTKPPRKQINMSPETQAKINELVEHVRTYSVQQDANVSEVFEGLVSAAHEARQQMDLSTVPARGQWGSPTAKAFPVQLKNAFQAAIASYFRLKQGQ